MGLFRLVKYTEKTISFPIVPNLTMFDMTVTFKLLLESMKIHGSIKKRRVVQFWFIMMLRHASGRKEKGFLAILKTRFDHVHTDGFIAIILLLKNTT